MAKEIKIYSENNDFQFVDTIKRNRTKRHRAGCFFVEGVNQINSLVKSRFKLRSLYFSRERKLSGWAEEILANSKADNHYNLPEGLMSKLSEKEERSELIAVAEMAADDPARLPLKKGGLYLVFDRPGNRGNLGSIMRSADALGCDGLIVTGHAVDIYDRETIRAGLGAFFTLPFVRMSSPAEIAEWTAKLHEVAADMQIVGTTVKTDSYIDSCDFRKTTVLLLGNETKGLSAGYKELAQSMVKIPIFGTASSLNVACAASIMLYEISRQRRLE